MQPERQIEKLLAPLSRPHADHGPDNPITMGIITAVQSHAHELLSRGMHEPLQVHLYCIPSEPALHQAISSTINGFGPARISIGRKNEPGFDEPAHIRIISTALEHEQKPEEALRKIRDSMRANGIFLLVSHDVESTFAEDLEDHASDVGFILDILNRARMGAISPKTAEAQLQDSVLSVSEKIAKKTWIRQFLKSGPAQKRVQHALEGRVAPNGSQMAANISESRITNRRALNEMLKRAGFANVAQMLLSAESKDQRHMFRVTGCFKDEDTARRFGFEPE